MTVVAALEAWSSVADTALTPPFSAIATGSSRRVIDGTPSSSLTVSVRAAGSTMPLPPVTAAPTMNVLSGSSMALGTAVIVTVPVLTVARAAMTRTVVAPRSTSPAAAGETGVTDTVAVVASLEPRLSRAVTMARPPFSAIAAGSSSSVNSGSASPSSITRSTWSGSDTPLPPVAVARTRTVLFGPSRSSLCAVIVTSPVLVSASAAMISVLPVRVK